MQVVFIVLNKIECLSELLEQFMEKGILGATILESQGMAQNLYEDSETTIMDSLYTLMRPFHPQNKTIFVVIEDEKVPLVSQIVNEVTGGLENHDTGVIFTMPVSYTEGFKKKDED
ncbi:hypothetical protein [Scatolibacter rhodanostii]|uniref:hypothetical protein n=1 Tax=Scatolibacter rhodanostii TaxID=2014781 RepID=UPI000C08C68B|nr:hypothetical protein [Scatolibacter rhodanostii]